MRRTLSFFCAFDSGPGLYGLCLVVAALSDKDTFGIHFFFVKMAMPPVLAAADLICFDTNNHF